MSSARSLRFNRKLSCKNLRRRKTVCRAHVCIKDQIIAHHVNASQSLLVQTNNRYGQLAHIGGLPGYRPRTPGAGKPLPVYRPGPASRCDLGHSRGERPGL